MPEIVHRISISSTPIEEVFQAFTTLQGLGDWWTHYVSGSPTLGGRLSFGFPTTGPEFDVVGLEKGRRVCWRCTGGPSEWVGTELDIRLEQSGDQVAVLFGHFKWRQVTPVMHHCSTQWAYFLIGLKRRFEHGAGTPFGGDYQAISDWSPSM